MMDKSVAPRRVLALVQYFCFGVDVIAAVTMSYEPMPFWFTAGLAVCGLVAFAASLGERFLYDGN